jgi:hypothetical protein
MTLAKIYPSRASSILGPFLAVLQMPLARAVVGVVALLMWAYAWVYYPIAQGHGGDFIAMLSGRQVDAGYWNGAGMGYGPIFAIYDFLFRGVSNLPAMRAMYAVNLAMLLLAFLVALQLFLPSPRTLEETVAAAFLWFCFYPTFQALRQNNVEITELFFLVLMLQALHMDRKVLAGVCLGIAGATKILPFVLVAYFIWRRRFTTAVVSILTGLGLSVLVIWIKGETLGASLSAWWSLAQMPWPSEFQNNQAISGFVWRAFSDFDLSTRATIETPLLLNAATARSVTIGASLSLFALVAAIMIQRTGGFPQLISDQRLETVEIAIVLISMLLLIPHNHTHYFILVAWIYLPALREWPLPNGVRGRWVFILFALSYILLGLLAIWRLFDPFLQWLGPVTGIDLARLVSLPFFGAIFGLVALLILHGHLLSVQKS